MAIDLSHALLQLSGQPGPAAHPTVSFWLDVADKLIKLLAVMVGAAWTWLNYHRSRTYAAKLELQLSGNLVTRNYLYIQITAAAKNLGAARFDYQQEGTFCELVAVMSDLAEIPVRVFTIFEIRDWIEPGETIADLKQCIVPPSLTRDAVWYRINLRVVSADIEWNASYLIPVGPAKRGNDEGNLIRFDARA